MIAKRGVPRIWTRATLAIFLLLLEIGLLSLLVDRPHSDKSSFILMLLSESYQLIRWFVVSIGVVIVGLYEGIESRTEMLRRQALRSEHLSIVASLHIALYVSLTIVTLQLVEGSSGYGSLLEIGWVLLLALSIFSWCFLISSGAGWIAFLRAERLLLLFALCAGAVIYILGSASFRYWPLLSGFTLQMTAIALSAFYEVIILDIEQFAIGARDFWVNIYQACSGIEGMVISASVTSMYLYFTRDQLRWPRALLLLPIACATSMAFNILRIALLVIIGAEWNPDIAVKGFHSVAGWIGTVLVALLIVFIFSNWHWIHRANSGLGVRESGPAEMTIATAILAPFLLFLSLSLLVKIFVDEFNYLYPVVIALVSLALTAAWRHYALEPPQRVVAAIATGSAIAALWVVLDSHDIASSHADFAALAALPVWQAIAWSLFRLGGFLIVTPLVEELVFRGYLLARLSGDGIALNEQPVYRLWPLLASSVLFGLLHPGWLAGIAAGVAFALLRFHSNRIADCILAHGVANGLLAIWFMLSWFNIP